jgi:pimeloyl-ACP methyl ester carboxylesterase
MASVKRTFRQPGVRRAALSYYRAMLAPRSESARRMDELMTRPIQVPTLAITGARDGCLDTRFFEHVPPRLFPAGLRTERIEGVGHFLHQEAPDDVNGLLLSWLREHA